jgi:hypothetical protein
MANSDRHWIKRAIAAGSIKAIASQITLTYLIPIGLPLVTAWVGYLQGLPWMYVFVGSGLMFGGVATGLVRFNEWIDRRSVTSKLTFTEPRIGRDIHGQGIFLGALFHNAANFPIELERQEMRTRLGNTVPAKTTYDVIKLIVPPHGNAWFDDHAIEIASPPNPGTIEGFVECRIKYGRVGDAKLDLAIRKQVVLSFNEDGLLGPCSWNDAAS